MKNIRKIVDRQIASGVSPEDILDRFKDSDERDDALYWIENSASLEDRKRYMAINILLVLLLAFVTLKKVALFAIIDVFDPLMLFSLVVPFINIYLIREILRYNSLGYKALTLLATISLVNAENRVLPEIVIMPAIALISGYIYFQLFIKRKRRLVTNNEAV